MQPIRPLPAAIFGLGGWTALHVLLSSYSRCQAARLEVFGPQDADSFEGLGLAKALADHLDGALFCSWPTAALRLGSS